MPLYGVRWSAYGDAFVEAESPEEAEKFVSGELMDWSGFGTDLASVEVDSVETIGDLTEVIA